MYSRNYFSDKECPPTPPDNYSGTALTEEISECADENFSKAEEVGAVKKDEHRENLFGDMFSADGGLSRIFSGGGIKSLFSSIGTEEILILAAAALLFFSKEGDKECAIMLFLLLFI